MAERLSDERLRDMREFTTDDPDEEAAIRALLDAVGDMTVALLPKAEC